MVLVRNDKWNKSSDPLRAERAFPDKVVVKFGQTPEVIDQILLSDKNKTAVSLDALLPTNLSAVFNDKGEVLPKYKGRAINVYDPYVRYAAVNVKKVNCLPLRQAIYYGKNFQSLITLAGGQAFNGDPADGVIKPLMGLDYAKTGFATGDKDWKPEGNVVKAKALMATASTECPELYARATDPKRGLIYDIADSPTNKNASAIWIESMAAIGITLKFNFIEASKYYPTVQDSTKQNDLSAAGWAPDWANASTVIPQLLTNQGGFNLTQNWDGDKAYPEFKKRSDANLSEPDRVKQGKEWAALNKYAMEQMWVIPGTFSKTQEIWGSKIGGAFFWEPQGALSFGDLFIKK
jgi:peptide/nickel transport system substrate-binding protein